MKKLLFKNCILLSLIVFGILAFEQNAVASEIIYQPTKESTETKSDIEKELQEIIDGVVKPKAEEVYIFNDVVKAKKNPNFVDKTTVYMPGVAEEAPKEVNNDYSVKYIRHTQSVTKIYEYEFVYDNSVNKWQLFFVNDDKISINPYSGMARSGFYKIGDNTYYFDEDGYMYVGILIDERDIVYNFNEEGLLVFEGKLG